jgi:hypothetical protein
VTETNVFQLAQPGTFTDSLTEVLRHGARALFVRANETEVAEFLGQHAELKTDDGRQRLVRHGHLACRTGLRSQWSSSWWKPRRYNQLPKVVQGVKFTDGIEVVRTQAQAAA